MDAALTRDLTNRLRGMLDRIARCEPIVEDLAEISRLQPRIQAAAPPQLSHFLERRSYAKALAFLEQGKVAEDPSRPLCDKEEQHP